MVPSICPHMRGEAVEAFREAGEASPSLACTLKELSACIQRPEHQALCNKSIHLDLILAVHDPPDGI